MGLTEYATVDDLCSKQHRRRWQDQRRLQHQHLVQRRQSLQPRHLRQQRVTSYLPAQELPPDRWASGATPCPPPALSGTTLGHVAARIESPSRNPLLRYRSRRRLLRSLHLRARLRPCFPHFNLISRCGHPCCKQARHQLKQPLQPLFDDFKASQMVTRRIKCCIKQRTRSVACRSSSRSTAFYHGRPSRCHHHHPKPSLRRSHRISKSFVQPSIYQGDRQAKSRTIWRKWQR